MMDLYPFIFVISGGFSIKLFTVFQSFARTVYNFFFTVTTSGYPNPAWKQQLTKLKRDCVVNYFGVIYIYALVPLLFYTWFFASKENYIGSGVFLIKIPLVYL